MAPTRSRVKLASPEERTEDTAMAIVVFLVFFSNALFSPLLPTLAREFSVAPTQLKWLIPGFSGVYGIATLAYGVVSDRAGRTPVLKRLLLIASIGMIVISLAHTAQQLIVLRAMSGLATGGIATIAISLIADRYPYQVQGKPMGRLFAGIAAGMGFGASLGPIASSLIGWRAILRCLAFGFLCSAGWVHQCYRGQGRQDKRHSFPVILKQYRCILHSVRGARALTFIFTNGLFHGGIFAWLGLFLTQRYNLSEAGVGLALLGYGIPDLLLGKRIGGWADRFGRRYVVPIGFLFAGACAALLAQPFEQWLAAVTIAALSFGFDATHPLLSSITTSLDPKHRGQVTGMTGFANFLGMATGALAFRYVLRFGFPQALSGFALLQLCVGVAAIICFRDEKPTPLGQDSSARQPASRRIPSET